MSCKNLHDMKIALDNTVYSVIFILSTSILKITVFVSYFYVLVS